MLGIVGGQQHRVALPRQLTHPLQHPQLVAVIQRGCGLVHHQNIRPLAQGAGDENQLLLAAGQGGEVPLRQLCHAHLLQRIHGMLFHPRRGRAERRQLPGQTHQRGVQHRIAEGGTVDLRDIGDVLRRLPPGQRAHVPAVQLDGAGIVRQSSQQTAEQRALARAVGAQHREEVAALRREGYPLQNRGGGLCVAIRQVFHCQRHDRSPPLTIR